MDSIFRAIKAPQEGEKMLGWEGDRDDPGWRRLGRWQNRIKASDAWATPRDGTGNLPVLASCVLFVEIALVVQIGGVLLQHGRCWRIVVGDGFCGSDWRSVMCRRWDAGCGSDWRSKLGVSGTLVVAVGVDDSDEIVGVPAAIASAGVVGDETDEFVGVPAAIASAGIVDNDGRLCEREENRTIVKSDDR
jgi:hypothetical protein